jgi:hypothetical protein
MSWQQINPRFVRQDHPGLRAAWYQDTTVRGGGELMVWLDPHDRVVAFQLSREEWPSMRHYVAEWQEGAALRTGKVDEEPRHSRPGLRPAPIMRFTTHPDTETATRLLTYFRQNATPVNPHHRQLISSVLGEAAA